MAAAPAAAELRETEVAKATVTIAETGNHFTVNFNGSVEIITTSTSSGADVDAWIAETLHLHRDRLASLVVGFDVEWRPSFGRAQNPVAVLQICVARRCLVFQIMHADYVPESLSDFLADERFTFVGVGIDGDAKRLSDDHGIGVHHAVDLRGLAFQRTGRSETKQMGIKRLTMEIMGVDVSKPKRITMSRWDKSVLTSDQIKYACVDAFLSFEIGRKLFEGEF